jgi:nucleoside phosphorylase
MPLSMMGKLAQTEKIDIFNRKIFIKGFSTMLVPTETHEDLLIWHLLYEKDGGRISYLDSHDIHAGSISISTLEASRHILGWCSEIRYNAGEDHFKSCILQTHMYTGAINSSYTVESCGLKAPHEGCKLEDVYVSGGQLITGCEDSAIGSKDRRHQVSRNSYGEKLSWISKKYVVMWDVGDKRGWLVNGSSALLHLLRMSLETNKTDSLKSRFVFRAEAMKGSTEPIPSDFATDVLSNPINLNLEIHMDEDGVIIPQTSSETLFPRRVFQSSGKHLRLKHRIERLYNLLEKMIDHQVGMSGQNGKLLRCRPRQVLEGWDFLDLATNEDPITPRVYKLRTRGKGWVDFTRAIHAITLFGVGFGEIFQPVCESDSCSYWSTLPHGKYYLAAGIADLSRIMKRRGNHRVHPMRLTDYISWNFENTAFEPCQCRGQQQSKHSNLAHNLLPSSPSREIPNHDPVKLPEQGAVAFGHNDDSGFIWNDYGDPEQGNLPDSSDELETEFDDSALGQSLSPPWSGTNRRMESFAFEPITTNDTTPNHKIGIVCALFTELMAVRTLFDETSEAPERADGDPNHYAFGRIGGHNVVAASLPCEDYGTNAAATVASHMLRSFPTVTYCLVVGIGGGVPSLQHDIRLGDIVVSTGVIQYDIGKNFPNVEFRSTATIQRPHQDLTNVINEFRSNPKLSYVPLQEYIQHIQTSRPEYARPTQDLDRLFDSNYVHNRSQETCGSCDDPQVQREPRSSIWPSIHYGLIASGNSVVKDAQLRDRFKNEVLCFEMEAAGIMKTLQCLSIRGISDYADSHKNDLWQAYAAAAAAAYTKFFLTHIRRPNSLARQQTGLTASSSSNPRKREAPGQAYSTTSAKRYR